MAFFVREAFVDPVLGLRLQSNVGVTFRAIKDEANERIKSDDGIGIPWWYQSGTQVFGDRVALEQVDTYTVSAAEFSAEEAAGPIFFMSPAGTNALTLAWFQDDGASGSGSLDYNIAYGDSKFTHRHIEAQYGFDYEFMIGAKSAAMRVEYLAFRFKAVAPGPLN